MNEPGEYTVTVAQGNDWNVGMNPEYMWDGYADSGVDALHRAINELQQEVK